MKKSKAIIALLLIAMMLINAFPAVAVEEASFEVETVTAQAGDTVDVTISIKNSPGITSTKLTVTFGEALTLTSVTYGTEITGNFVKPKNMTSPIILNWANGLEDFSGDYVFATLSFQIAENAETGLHPITVIYDPDDVYNVEETNQEFTIKDGGITVLCPHANTTDVPETPADCDESGYTAGVYCNDCQTYISGHTLLPATGEHTDADGKWESDEVNHFRTCDCGHIFDTAAHSGGTATCTQKAKCETCGAEYGSVDAKNHVGGTTVINASEPNHETQTPGYTGDTKCLGCGEIITYGQPIEPGVHTPANVWSSDATYHWKECNVVGCGVVIDGSKAEHVSTGSNVATCQKQAVCDVCGISYGELASHNYTAQIIKEEALKTAGNCRDYAVYYYSCAVCGQVENNDTYTFNGDKVASDHVGGTTTVNATAPDHKTQTNGYSGDTKCLGCGEIIIYGQTIAPDAHAPADVWSSDGSYHWKECNVTGCGVMIDGSKAEHTSTGTSVATCQKQAVCDVCGVTYGTVADHDWNDSWSKDASGHWYACQTSGCTEKGSFAAHTPDHDGGASEDYAVKCTKCQYVIYAQLAHTHVYDQEVASDAYKASNATCEDLATYYKSCKCGEKGSETFEYGELADHTWNDATCTDPKTCSVCGMTEGSANGHTTGSEWQKDATHHWKLCTVVGCGVVIEESKAAHTPDHEGGATEDYAILCSVCGYEMEAQLAHTHVYDKEVATDAYKASNATCEELATYYKSCKCGDKGAETFEYGELADHTWNNATCTEPKTCSVCGTTEGSASGHTEDTEWTSDSDSHWHICSVAGCGVIIESSKAAHTPDREAATETAPIKCSVCGYEIAPALGHTHAHSTDWKSDKDNHWNECACGDKANTANHADENEDGICDTCGYNVGLPADPSSPQTGDNSIIWLWIALLLVSCMGIVVITIVGKKRYSVR